MFSFQGQIEVCRSNLRFRGFRVLNESEMWSINVASNVDRNG